HRACRPAGPLPVGLLPAGPLPAGRRATPGRRAATGPRGCCSSLPPEPRLPGPQEIALDSYIVRRSTVYESNSTPYWNRRRGPTMNTDLASPDTARAGAHAGLA